MTHLGLMSRHFWYTPVLAFVFHGKPGHCQVVLKLARSEYVGVGGLTLRVGVFAGNREFSDHVFKVQVKAMLAMLVVVAQ